MVDLHSIGMSFTHLDWQENYIPALHSLPCNLPSLTLVPVEKTVFKGGYAVKDQDEGRIDQSQACIPRTERELRCR